MRSSAVAWNPPATSTPLPASIAIPLSRDLRIHTLAEWVLVWTVNTFQLAHIATQITVANDIRQP